MTPQSEIDELLRRGQVDEPLFAETLVRNYHAYVYRLAFSVLGDPDDAADAAQVAFVESLANIDRYQCGTNL